MLVYQSSVGRIKSFVDDLNIEQGIVSMRVALCYDLLRFILCSGDLCVQFTCKLIAQLTLPLFNTM